MTCHLDVVNLLLERGAAIESGNFDDRRLLRYIPPHDHIEQWRASSFNANVNLELCGTKEIGDDF
jgi:hypothetical protein